MQAVGQNSGRCRRDRRCWPGLPGPRRALPNTARTDKPKTPAEIAAEKDAERAYRRSLGNIPEQQKTDPWGTVRSDSAPPKAAAKAPPAKPKAKSAEGAAKQ